MRIRKFVFEGVDTTRIAEPRTFTAEQVEDMVRRKMDEAACLAHAEDRAVAVGRDRKERGA